MATASVHYIEKCEHGTIVAQCRCPALNGAKAVHIVPCPVACPYNVEGRKIEPPGPPGRL